MGGSFPATLTVSDERTDAGPDGATTSASTTKPVAVNRPPNATPDGGAIDICADGTKTTDINVVENDATNPDTTDTVEDQTAYRDQDGDLIGIKSITASDATGMAERAPAPRNKIRYTPPAGDTFSGTTTTDTFAYTLRDQYDATSTADVNVEVANQGGCGNLTVNFVSSEGGPATSTANPLYDGDPLARQTGTSTEWNLSLAGTSTNGRLASLLSGPHYDFESGTQGWNTPAGSFTTKSSHAFENGQSIGITQPDAPANGAFIEPDALQGGNQIDRFQFYYRETNKSYGGGVQLLDSDDNVVTGVGTDNPQWVVVEPDGDGGTSPTRFDTNTGDYKAWTKVTMDFDWSAETVDVTFKRMDTDASTSYTANLQKATNVARIQLDNANGSPFFNSSGHNNWYMWYDDISIQPAADAGTVTADDFQIDTPNGFVLAKDDFGQPEIFKDTETGQNLTGNEHSTLLAADYEAQVPTNQPPSAQFSYTPSNPTTADTVTFDGSGSSDEDGSIANYSWSGDDDLTGSGATTTHSFSAVGDYQVTLEVEDDNGATSSTSQTVTVDDGCETVALGSDPADQLNAVADQCGYNNGTFESSDSASDTVDFTIADIADNNENVTLSDYELQWLQIEDFQSYGNYEVKDDDDGGSASVDTHTVDIDGSQATATAPFTVTADNGDSNFIGKHSTLVYEPGDAGLSASSSVNLQGEASCSLPSNYGDATDNPTAYAQAFSIEARFCPNGASDPEPVPDDGPYEYQQVEEVRGDATCPPDESDQTSLTQNQTVYTADGTEKELRVTWEVTAQTDGSGTGSSSARLKGTRLDDGSVDYDITNDGSDGEPNKGKSDEYETIPGDGDSIEIDEAQASCGGIPNGGSASWSVTVEELVPAN